MTALILDWHAASEAGPAHAGGKGSQLGTLSELGLPVPPGFVVDAAASRGRRRGAAVPESLASAFAEELDRLGWQDQPLAVRSSAPLEDSARASFAGLFRSCLNVRGLDALLSAVREVWDSAGSAAVAAYRERLQLADADAGMAIVVMPLLPAVASGIAFTCDPATGRTDQWMIQAHWGLGEALVSGQAEGDEYRLQVGESDTLRLLESRVGRKARTAVPSPLGGTELRDTAADLAARRVLTAPQITALTELLRDTASALDYTDPRYDIEWVWDGARFWIVQARPVTRSGRHTYASLAAQPAILSRMNSREVVPEPLAALEWTSIRDPLHRMLTCSLELGGYRPLPGVRRMAIRHGRLYFDTSTFQWEAFDCYGLLPKAATEMMGGHQPQITTPSPTLLDRTVRAWRSVLYLVRCIGPRRRAKVTLRRAREQAAEWLASSEPAAVSELVRQFRAHSDVLRRADDLYFLQVSSASIYFILLDLAEKHCPGEGQGLAAALLAGGEPSVTAAQSYELMELARIAEADAPALAWLRRSDRIGGNWRDELAGESPFRRAFAIFIERYGHRGIYESHLRNPRWRETPDYLLDTVIGLVGCDPAALRKRQLEAASEARRRLSRALPIWLRPLIGVLVRFAVIERNLREAGRSALMAYAEIVRRDALALGRRWTGPARPDSPEDLFHLTLLEVLSASEGHLPLGVAARRAARRRRQLEEWASNPEPEVIVEDGDAVSPSAPAEAERDAASSSDTASNSASVTKGKDVWHGTVVGSGRARGPACVARHPTDALGMATGAVLVAPSTDPAWTPLFLRAGALVVEMGGYLSHGAIVARELGIPAVVNLPGILARVANGDLLEVDGSRGTVRRL